MEKLNMHTRDMAEANIEKIGQLFPNCLTERLNENGYTEIAIDFDRLKQELSKDIVEGNRERYQFIWPGKREAMRTAYTPINKTLRPCRDESLDFDNTQNLYIEGDNLEVLKLLQENYLGKVKMIYIDPPYFSGVYEQSLEIIKNICNDIVIVEHVVNIDFSEDFDIIKQKKYLNLFLIFMITN